MWNVNGRIEHHLPRTNDAIEGWQHSFDLQISIPTLRFSTKLVNEQASNQLLQEQILQEFLPLPPKKEAPGREFKAEGYCQEN